MNAADYLGGLACFAAMLGGTLAGAAIVVRRRLDHLRGATRVVAFALVSTGALIAVHVVPGALGVLSRGTVIVATALWVAAALAVHSASPAVEGGGDEPVEDDRTMRWMAAAGVVAVLVFGIATAYSQLAVAPRSVDLMNFHLPGVAEWIQTGSIWHVTELLPNVAPGAYPNNGDVVLLAAVLPWHDDFLAHLSLYPFYALTGIAMYALAREFGATRVWSCLAAATVLAIPTVAVTALVASLVDPVLLATFAGGLLFLARHRRSRARSDLVLAGLGLGLAFGTKWYGVSAVAIVLAVWVGARLVGRERVRWVARDLGLVSGLVLAAGGIWLLRNWIEIGNPFFPVRVQALGTTIFAAPNDVVRAAIGSTLLDYVGNWGAWTNGIFTQLRHALAAPGGLIFLGGVASIALLGVRPARRFRGGRGPLAAGLVAGALLVIAYAVTPYTAGGLPGHPVLVAADSRYIGGALVVFAAVGAATISSLRGRWAVVAGSLCLLAIADGLRWSSGGWRTLASLSAGDWAVAIGVVLAGGALALMVRQRRPSFSVGTASIGLATSLALAAAAGYVVQRHFNAHRYLGGESAIDWLDHHPSPGQRVALAGLWDDAGMSPVLPAFGPRLSNHVSYLGVNRGGFLYRYHSRSGFAAALDRGRYSLVIVGLGRPGSRAVPELRWALAAGYRRVVGSRRLELLERS